MTTPPLPSPSAPHWPHCGEGAATADPVGCLGRQVPGESLCLAHLAPAARARYLATLSPGSDIDHRGTTFAESLLSQLLAALRDPTSHRPHLGSAQFHDVTFSADAWFHGVTFSADAGFSRATFSGPARFDRATFSGTAQFDRATFSDTAWFDGARFSGPARFDRARFSGPASRPPAPPRRRRRSPHCGRAAPAGGRLPAPPTARGPARHAGTPPRPHPEPR
ncbi:hypothetical protein SLUN_01015 [Streptomyces lunaelactis]|uniref:Pentapeptide repeat-containing protein n=1 Tax=Streptomyces lunaelactis TaxID=1535768 RepID=A0A2R4TDD9_9ACTN|nr:hypothetical protein SLUN_01015 [Streptomyces lunaelactis]NUK24056.1 pentapeptide repeat-containing protein [Streptomyces lunaelactis]NUK85692.1 pentapeptide repeat-containing protein [Streptomyces lunaelactis]